MRLANRILFVLGPVVACRRGTSAIEFALLAPLFILTIAAMLALGIYLGASHSLQQIAADATRSAIAGLDETERRELATRFIDRNTDAYAFIDRDRLALEVSDSPLDANQFVVSLRYDARDLPIWNLVRGLPLPGTVITRASTIRIGGR